MRSPIDGDGTGTPHGGTPGPAIPGGVTVYVASRLIADAGRAFAPGAVAVAGDTVLAAGARDDVLRAAPSGAPVTDLPGIAILPGLVNAHTHLQIPPLPPARADDGPPPPFVDWILRIVAWRRTAAPEEFARNMEAASRESLAAGTTTIGEIAGPDPSAYSLLPLRARIFAEGIGFLPEAADEVLRGTARTLDLLSEISALRPTVRTGVSPHTLYTVGPELLRGLARLAHGRGLPVALHLAESPAEGEFLRSGAGDVAVRLYPAVGKDVSFFRGIGAPLDRYLADAGLLRPGLLLVHNVHLSPEEVGALRDGGARFVLCPRSNRAHGNGAPDVTRFVDDGVPFALGTDSRASVPSLSLWDEAREARALYRGRRDEGVLCRALFEAVTTNGAAALAIPGGSLSAGAPADFLAVDDPGGEGIGALRRLVDRTEIRNVRLVAVAGRILHGC